MGEPLEAPFQARRKSELGPEQQRGLQEDQDETSREEGRAFRTRAEASVSPAVGSQPTEGCLRGRGSDGGWGPRREGRLWGLVAEQWGSTSSRDRSCRWLAKAACWATPEF